MLSKPRIIELAKIYGWVFDLERQPNPHMLSFFKGEMRINVYHTTMTVSTALRHPIKGKTQLYRRNVNEKMLKQIFEFPRVHTGRGYFHAPIDHMGEQQDALHEA